MHVSRSARSLLIAAVFVVLSALACSSTPIHSTVVKRDGSVVIGQIVDAQPEAIVVKDGSGASQTIKRTDIASILAADDASAQQASSGGPAGGATAGGGSA